MINKKHHLKSIVFTDGQNHYCGLYVWQRSTQIAISITTFEIQLIQFANCISYANEIRLSKSNGNKKS